MFKYKPEHQKISLFGHFGAANFGNESTLQAMLFHLRRLSPDAALVCICSEPEIVAANYNIAAVPIRASLITAWNPRNRFARLARRLFIGFPCEFYRWIDGVMTLRNTDMLIVVGTGLLTDAFGIDAWGPYNTFKWSLIAKLCGCKLMFTSVGAGPLRRRSGQLLVKLALSLANFRSYRDEATSEYLKRLGFRPNDDRVYPDLAFSLPTIPFEHNLARESRPVVGLGLMLHAGMYGVEETTGTHYTAYLNTLATFAGWLVERGYMIRILIGDLTDIDAIQAFQLLLKERSIAHEDQIIVEPIESAQDLLSQLSATDFVVGTRFHNILLALLLNKPSIAISFHDKCSSLMNSMGLAEYCEDIKQLNITWLIEQFQRLEMNSSDLKFMLRDKVAKSNEMLEEQYISIFRAVSKQPVADGVNTRVAT